MLSKISRLPQESFLIACSSLKLMVLRTTSTFPECKPAVTNSMHSQSNYTPKSRALVDLRRIFLTQTILKIGHLHIKNSLCKKLLNTNFNCNLNSVKHIEDNCQNSSRKLNALASLTPYMASSKRSILTNAFCMSEFTIVS